MTEKTKKKISETMKGKRNKLGAKLSNETKEKIREIRIGSIHSQTTKDRMSASHQKHIKLSMEDLLEIVSEIQKGE